MNIFMAKIYFVHKHNFIAKIYFVHNFCYKCPHCCKQIIAADNPLLQTTNVYLA